MPDQGHVLHPTVRRWQAREAQHGWTTCPIAENGMARVLAHPTYPNCQPVFLVASWLAEAYRYLSHTFRPEPISLLQKGLIDWQQLLGPRLITVTTCWRWWSAKGVASWPLIIV